MDYFPYAWMSLLAPLMAILNAAFGIGVFYKNDAVKYNPLWLRKRR